MPGRTEEAMPCPRTCPHFFQYPSEATIKLPLYVVEKQHFGGTMKKERFFKHNHRRSSISCNSQLGLCWQRLHRQSFPPSLNPELGSASFLTVIPQGVEPRRVSTSLLLPLLVCCLLSKPEFFKGRGQVWFVRT